MIIPVILAGGSGTRLWPLSRQLYPKQLMGLVDEFTMLQNTMLRLTRYQGMGDPIIICNDHHRFMIAEQAREIEVDPAAIILESVGRNTAPAVAVGALKALAVDPAAVILVLPADHFIADVTRFHEVLKGGEVLAGQEYLITFGIVPQAPETGYGYIKRGEQITGAPVTSKAYKIKEFVEKPDKRTAETYLASGRYFWNSGIFMFKASRVLEELKKHVPDIVEACESAFTGGKEDLDFFRLDARAFEACPGDSIDTAVMERTDRGAMVPFDAGWNDLGSWEALWEVGEKDDSGNVVSGDVIAHDVTNSYLHATGRMIAAVGLDNHIVVETADAVLISPRERVQDVKRIVDQLKAGNRDEALSHKKEYRPWGFSERIDAADRFLVNRIMVNPGAKLSLQKHYHRAEHWIVVTGTASVTKGDEHFILKEDQSTYIPVGTAHRLDNLGKIPLEFIEVLSGNILE